MEERLDDAIHVLRNHAEGQQMPGLSGPGHSGMAGHMMPSSHSNGIMGNIGYNNMIGHGSQVESPSMVCVRTMCHIVLYQGAFLK